MISHQIHVVSRNIFFYISSGQALHNKFYQLLQIRVWMIRNSELQVFYKLSFERHFQNNFKQVILFFLVCLVPVTCTDNKEWAALLPWERTEEGGENPPKEAGPGCLGVNNKNLHDLDCFLPLLSGSTLGWKVWPKSVFLKYLHEMDNQWISRG